MIDCWPVLVEIERRAVIEVVAFQAVVDRLLLPFRGVNGEDQLLTQPISFGGTGTNIATFHCGMGGCRSMAVFATVMSEVRGLIHAEETSLEWFKTLGRPADDMTGKAFRVGVTPRILFFKCGQGKGVG
jgi:hypothetical protein